jgi:hypothetical protein
MQLLESKIQEAKSKKDTLKARAQSAKFVSLKLLCPKNTCDKQRTNIESHSRLWVFAGLLRRSVKCLETSILAVRCLLLRGWKKKVEFLTLLPVIE